MPKLVEIGPVVLEKKKKMLLKIYNDDDNEDDLDRQRTHCDQKSSRVLGSGELTNMKKLHVYHVVKKTFFKKIWVIYVPLIYAQIVDIPKLTLYLKRQVRIKIWMIKYKKR